MWAWSQLVVPRPTRVGTGRSAPPQNRIPSAPSQYGSRPRRSVQRPALRGDHPVSDVLHPVCVVLLDRSRQLDDDEKSRCDQDPIPDVSSDSFLCVSHSNPGLEGLTARWIGSLASGDRGAGATRRELRPNPGADHFLVRAVVRGHRFRSIKTDVCYRFEPCRRSQAVDAARHCLAVQRTEGSAALPSCLDSPIPEERNKGRSVSLQSSSRSCAPQ